MGAFFHVLKANKTNTRPTNWVVFDCEANIKEAAGGEQTHTLRLGCGRYHRIARSGKREQLHNFDFDAGRAFWNRCLELSEPDRRLVLFGYNIGYDLRMVEAFSILRQLGYTQNRIYVGGQVVIVGWRKEKHTIVAIDACNYFDGKLEQWGDLLGKPKGKVAFRTVTDDALLSYCWRDVDILDTLLLRWWAFIDKHDLGCFSPTKASQSFNAYRHRFMPCKIQIHANTRASAVERAAYHGGRVECFHIGELTDGPYYKFDVNSMYPYIMTKTPVPVCYKSVGSYLDVPTLKRLLRRYAVCGLFDVSTDEPAYTYRHGTDLVYPVGRFQAHLSTPEVAYGLKHGHIRKGLRVAIYDKAVIFRDYVRYFYRLRQQYDKQGDLIFKTMVKYFMLSLYGKFGQRSERWVKGDNIFDDPDGGHFEFQGDPPQLVRYVVISGQRWDIKESSESYHAFPAIAAHLTAAARMYLWSLIVKAGRSEVFYCDTDSLITTRLGRRRLREYLDENVLGKLKCEYKTTRLLISAPKEYRTDREYKHKGIKADAIEIQPGVFQQLQWEGLRGAIMAGRPDEIHLKPVVKVLARQYRKGVVHSSGSVSPIVLEAD